MTTSFVYDIKRDCALLAQDKSFPKLFELICAHGDVDAAQWIEAGEIRTLTFNQQRQLADNYAAAFANRIGTSGRVCICLDSCKDWFAIFWGLIRSGHDILTVDASADDAKLTMLMHQCRCDILVCGTERVVPAKHIIQASEMVESPDVIDYQPVWGHDIALCTSGTTADSRIFLYNEETICYLALFSSKVYDDNHLLIDNCCFKTLAFLPFHHILGFAAIFIWSHFLGDTTVYLKDRTPQTIIDTCHRCHVNQIVSVPLLANNLARGVKAEIAKQGKVVSALVETMEFISLGIQAVFPRLGLALANCMFKGIQKKLLGTEMKSIVLGGSSTDQRTLRHLNALGYYTICGFGMTETAINSFETSYRLANRIRGSIGAPMLYTEFRVRNAGGLFSNIGELQIRGKGLHDGRIVDGKILPPDVDADGWFSTGDVIRMRKFCHENFILGRIKDVIINESGENVYPDELEECFRDVEGVDQLVILGTRKHGSRYEDITLALNIGARVDDPKFIANLESQIIRINKTLPVYKRLTRAIISAQRFPTTSTLKVKRLELRDKIRSEAFPFSDLNLSRKNTAFKQEDTTLKAKQQASDKIRRQMAEIFATVLNVPKAKIDPDANIVEAFNGDSLQVLSIVAKAEETFGVMIPAEMYTACASVNEAATLIEKLIYGDSNESQEQRFVIRKPISSFDQTEEYIHFQDRINALLKDGGKNPYFVCHDSPLLDTSMVNGREMLDFGSYNYVGMSGRPEVSAAAKAAIDKYGTSASGSRLLAGEKPIHGELEREIAEWKHAEKALVCVGGHSTNVTIVGNFCGKNDMILYDALAHNSVEQGCRLSKAVARPFPHNDVTALEHILQAQRQYFEKVLIVIEGVYSMDGDIAPVPDFVALKRKYQCFLMVDEAHSACVLGPTGGGVDEHFGLNSDDIDIKMGTLSKGLGTCGGYLAGKACLIDYLRYNLPGFVFSVGMSPALAAGSLEAVRLLRSRPDIMQALHRNIQCFASEAKKRHLDIGLGGQAAVIPVIVGPDENAFAISTEMEKRGILVPPAVYPAVPKNKARLRFDVISEHKPEQIIRALDTLVQVAHDLGITLPQRDYADA